jgi:polyisoprenyl-phosphate glycosyltransferase
MGSEGLQVIRVNPIAPSNSSSADGGRRSLAVVIPVFNEEELLPELCRRLAAACASVADLDWQVIFVDDGSRDASARIILEQRTAEPRFTLVRLSRNFGHQPAITAGLVHADADGVVIMDADLQDPPELIPELVAAWRAGGQVILAERRSRQERGLRRLGFDLFHRFFGMLTDFPIPANAGVFGLLDRLAVDQLVALTERNRFLPGLRSWIGFDQRVVYYDRQDRAAGQPKQTFRRLVRYAMDGIFSFSFKPLRMMTWAGVLVAAIGFITALVFILRRLFFADPAVTGFTTLLTMMMFLGGVQLIAIGLLGEYIGRIYDEVKNRPIYIAASRHGVKPRAAATRG